MSDKTLELQIRIAAEDAARIVSALKDDFKTLADEAGKYAKNEGQEINKRFKETEEAAKDSAKSIDDIFKAMGRLTEVIAATKALSFIKDMGVFALQSADNFQTMKNQFGTLLGDMEAGAGLFAEIKAFGDVTPFDLDTLTQATNVLISAKVPLSELQNQLTKFGDLSQGNSQKMTSYVNAFSQASAKGKADMQILNTYLNQGVPILDALAKNFGKTTAEIIEMSSKGEISFADFSKALDDLTAAGGQYFGGMELASKSLAAMQEGLSEAVNTLGASFGEMLMPAALAVIGALTEITNAINESPLLQGLLIGAVVALTGYLAAMAIKAGIAFAAQMALNLSIGALNPVVLATTIAVAGMAAGYTAMAAKAQAAAREEEGHALALRKKYSAINDFAGAAKGYADSFKNMAGENIAGDIKKATDKVSSLTSAIEREKEKLEQLKNSFRDEGRDHLAETAPVVKKMEADIERMRNDLASAEAELKAINAGYQQFRQADKSAPAPIDEKAKKAAADWLAQWRDQYAKFQAEISGNPFAMIEIELKATLKEANLHGASKKVIDEINEYYSNERKKVIEDLKSQEERIITSLTQTKLDDIELQKREELKALSELEQARIFSAQYTEEEIAEIKKQFEQMRNDTEIKFSIEIDKTKLDEARDSIRNWQEVLSDNLLTAFLNLESFNAKAAVIFADLTQQLIELSGAAALTGFEEFGRALGQGEDAAESMNRALTVMAQQILKQLPMMFLQAGLQLIAQGQWPLGLGFIAAAGSTAIISGYVDGDISKREKAAKEMSKHAQGGVFDEYGKAAQAFAAGGTFTNQIVSTPTYFAHGGGFGLMGEAGPEAIMPLTRMTDGKLGVQTSGTGQNVIININNYSSETVSKEETKNADGTRQLEITIGNAVDKYFSSGKPDRLMASRYGLRHVGV